MGQQLTKEEVAEAQKLSNFTEGEIQKIYKQFVALDADGSGTLTTDEFLSIPELAVNPLLQRIIDVFDSNRDNQIQFTEFIGALHTFMDKDDTEGKLRCKLTDFIMHNF